MPILKDEFIKDSFEQNSIEPKIKKILKLCLVLPNSNDVRFCSDRAFGRGDDGVHEAGDQYLHFCTYACTYYSKYVLQF
jgi:hypothetical protein